ncbi:Anthranilate synthase component 1 OS=Lysinibacillus sphaericus OX=1421 GN=LS41612_07375 PE=4 SV=1 [Lysinibacillus sphaericus]
MQVLFRLYNKKLATVCFPDSIKLVETMKIERSKQAMHMTSRLEGQRLPMLHAVDVLAAMMPTFAAINIANEQTVEKTAQTSKVFLVELLDL